MTHDWRADAACLGEDPELWFPVGTEGPAQVQAAAAQEICAHCPVAEQCYQLGLALGAKSGIWGGRWFDVRGKVPAAV